MKPQEPRGLLAEGLQGVKVGSGEQGPPEAMLWRSEVRQAWGVGQNQSIQQSRGVSLHKKKLLQSQLQHRPFTPNLLKLNQEIVIWQLCNHRKFSHRLMRSQRGKIIFTDGRTATQACK